MPLKHYEGWNVPPDAPFYPKLPAVYRNVKLQLVFFYALPRAVAEYLPGPLKASEDGLCVAGGLDVPFSSNYGAFQESLILMKCHFKKKTGFYCSHVFHNGPAGIAAGREIYGTPKVWAKLRVRALERTMLTETFMAGVPVLNITTSYEEVGGEDTIPNLSPTWRIKIIPRADGPGPAIKQLIDCTKVMHDSTLHFHARGKGSIGVGASPLCDLTPLAPLRYGEAFYREVSYSEGFAEIEYDYLKNK